MDFLSLSLFSKPNCPKPLQKNENKTKSAFPSPGVAQIYPPIGWEPPHPQQQPSPSPGQGETKAQSCFPQAHPDLGLTSVRYSRQCHTLGLGDTGITHCCHPLPARRDQEDEPEQPRAPCSWGRLSLAGWTAQGHVRSLVLPLMPWKMLYGSSGRPGNNKSKFLQIFRSHSIPWDAAPTSSPGARQLQLVAQHHIPAKGTSETQGVHVHPQLQENIPLDEF